MNDGNQVVNTGKKTTALVCGIIAVVLGFIGIFWWYLAIPGLVLGIIAVVSAVGSSKVNVPATAGLVTGILGIVFSGIGIACWVACASAANSLT